MLGRDSPVERETIVMTDRIWTGRCNCGLVTLQAIGEPKRIGVCHCLTCRRETGSAFLVFIVWPRDRVESTGELRSWRDTRADRFYCPQCGSRMFNTDEGDEIEVRLGILEEVPSSFQPDHECWTSRRENWLWPIAGAKQYSHGRTEG